MVALMDDVEMSSIDDLGILTRQLENAVKREWWIGH